MMNRRDFMGKTLVGSAALIATSPLSAAELLKPAAVADLKISLAQWSLHRALEKKLIKAEDFASIAMNSFQINAVEYVNGFYSDNATDEKFWNSMKKRADEAGVESLLIMVDSEGDLGDPNYAKRTKAVENHYKWIDAAKLLNCHSIRVNAFGTSDRDELKESLTDGLAQLAEYGAQSKINVLIENHGLHTSDADFIVDIIKAVNNPYLGTLPDFGNWCMSKEWGSTMGGKCEKVFDIYQGVNQFLPYAKGVSAKSYEFDSSGNETSIDYKKMLSMVKSAGFEGHVGIEYEGSAMSEEEGIRATKSLLEKAWAEI